MTANRSFEGNRCPSRLANDAGVTFAEMIMTLFVFMLLGLTAQPVFSEMMKTFKLHGATRQVFAEMQRARMTAISENARTQAHMTSGNLQFQRWNVTTSAWEAMPKQGLTSDDTAGMVLSMADITFSPNGTAVNSGSLIITDSSGNYRTISVSPAGSIRVD